MNIARIGLLVVAIVAAGVAAFLVRSLTGQEKAQAPVVQVAPVEETRVLVAARPLSVGVLVKPGDMRWQAWPAEGVAQVFLSEKSAPNAMDDLVGGMVRSALEVGEPVTRTKVVHAKDAGFMAAMLTPGMRAVSTRITAESGAGGFILPNDRVDVILTQKVDNNNESGSSRAFDTRTVLENVRVLAIDQAFDGPEGAPSLVGKTATLELTPNQSELLALAGAMGDLTLSLRSAAIGETTAAIAKRTGGFGLGSDGVVQVVRYSRAVKTKPAGQSGGPF